MHQHILLLLILSPLFDVVCLQIPRISNISLIPIAPVNFTTVLNSTCDQCICLAAAQRSAALNCFLNNNTCQLFARFPIRYRLQPVAQAQLYFPTGVFPNASQCCMPNITLLLAKLNTATTITATQPYPRCLAVDSHGYLLTIRYAGTAIRRFNPLNLTFIDQINITQGNIRTVAFHNNAYFVGTDSNTVEVVDGTSLSTVNVISHPDIYWVRDTIFLRDGQTMIVSSTSNQKLLFFNRSNTSPVNYTYSYQLSTSYPAPHGLWYVNDSFFHATSWDWNSVYSHATTNGVSWNETLFANVNNVVNTGGVTHVMVDECGRRWASGDGNTLIIYDSSGVYVGNLSIATGGIFDALITDNYVLYISDFSASKVLRLDPHITC